MMILAPRIYEGGVPRKGRGSIKIETPPVIRAYLADASPLLKAGAEAACGRSENTYLEENIKWQRDYLAKK